MGREGQPYPNGTFRTLLNPIKQLIVSRSKLAICGTSRSMELPAQWNFPLGFSVEPLRGYRPLSCPCLGSRVKTGGRVCPELSQPICNEISRVFFEKILPSRRTSGKIFISFGAIWQNLFKNNIVAGLSAHPVLTEIDQ
jgi:hypothetical protein